MSPLTQLLGGSRGVVAVREQVARLLQRHAVGARRLPSLLILGETGTGKGLLASAIHRAGPRAAGPFVDVNCAAIPEALLEAELFGFERGAFTDARQAKAGLFQAAHLGTLFLDEVGLLPEGLQAKLLKVLEERTVRRLGSTRSEPVDIWLVAATNEELPAAVRARRFREDLYHRLAVLTLRLPPLRERGEDILMLAEHFLARACEDYGLAPRTLLPDAETALRAHAWPGNVRELANVMERVALLSDGAAVTAATLGLPAASRHHDASPAGERRAVAEAEADTERARLLEALRAVKGNLSRAAAQLGIPRNTLRYRLVRLGLTMGGGSARHRDGSTEAPDEPGAAPAPVFIPPSAEQRAPGSLRWEPRRIAMLRAQLVASKPEPDSTQTARAMEVIVDKVRSFGGRVDQLGSATLVAAFGLEPLEDAPRRAAYAALAIQTVLVKAQREDPTRPTVVLGLHAERLPVARLGDALEIDADARRRVRAILDVLADRAEPGTTMVSAHAVALLARRFELVPAGAGAALSGEALRLAGAARVERDLGPLVGRAVELRLLGERFEQARAGQGQVISIVGEPGIGKSRLLRELRRQWAGAATWLEGQAIPFGRPVPFHPLIDLLRRASGLGEADEGEVAAERLQAYVLGLGEDLRPTLPFLRDLLAFDPSDPAVAAMDSNLRRVGILDAVRRLLHRVAERGPVVVVLEDLHWADQATVEFLAPLADGLSSLSVLMICTHRPGHPSPVGDRSFHTRLPLVSLSAPDSVEVARHLLGAAEVPEELRTLIVRKAVGNPFFVEELVRMLQDLGGLQRTGDGWRLVAQPDRSELPDTVQDVILTRVDRLKQTAREALEVASVIGTDVPIPLLQSAGELPPERLHEALQDLRASELLYETGPSSGQEYTFKHAVIQEVVYGHVPADRRRELHARLVDAIERTHPERLGEHLDRLAHHATRGERWESALVYARQAAARARAQSAYREMAMFLEQAVDALQHRPQDRAALEHAVDLRFELRDAYNALREPERVVQWLGEAETLAQTLSDPLRLARVASYMSQYFWVEGRSEQAIEVGRRALSSARALGDLGLQVATAFYLGRAHYAVGDHAQAIEHLRWNVTTLDGGRAHHRYGVAGFPSVLSRIWLAWCYAESGRFEEAISCGDEAVRIATEGNDPFTRVGALLAGGRARLQRGDASRAVADLEQSLGLARAWDIPVWVPIASAELGAAHVQGGRLPEAIRLLEQAVSTPWKVDVALWAAWLSEAHLVAGRRAASASLASRALGLARAHGERGNEAYVLRLQGAIAASGQESAAEAADLFRRSLALADELGMRPLAAHCHFGLGMLYRQHRAGDLAEPHLATATATYEALGMVRWRERAEAVRDVARRPA